MLDLKRHGWPQWKLEKTLDRVEQAEPRGDHIIIVVIAAFTYRLYQRRRNRVGHGPHTFENS